MFDFLKTIFEIAHLRVYTEKQHNSTSL